MNLHDLDTIRPTPLGEEIERRRADRAPMRPIPEPDRTTHRILAGVTAFVVFGAAVALWASAITDRSAVGHLWGDYGSGWTQLPAPPVWRNGATLVWAGDRLLYWGGGDRGAGGGLGTTEGYSFDPVSGEWTSMPPAPLPGKGDIGIWTGSEALFFSRNGDAVHTLSFDPATGTWSTFPRGPKDPHILSSWTWAGSEVIAFGGASRRPAFGEVSRRQPRTAVQGWAFDPIDGSWRRLPDAPKPIWFPSAAWDGDELFVVGYAGTNMDPTTAKLQAQAYDAASDAWRSLPRPPLPAEDAGIFDVGGRLIVWEPGGASAEWLPTVGRWRPIDTSTLRQTYCYGNGAVAGDELFSWDCGSPVTWSSATSAWRSVERPIAADPSFAYAWGVTLAAGDAIVVSESEAVPGATGEPIFGAGAEYLWVWKS